jgi:glycine/D-amino acid oxidase-like deaminating enzyme
MCGSLYVFQGEGIADGAANRRHGARHALVVFATAPNLDRAEAEALSQVAANGWAHVTFTRGAEVNVQPTDVTDGYLKAALQDAIENGSAVVAYVDELPANA